VLINFSVDHFRSFGAEQTLNMVATPLRDHPGHCVPIPHTEKSVLQVGVIYGANASGKSNLVKAMLYAKFMIVGRLPLSQLALNSFRFLKKKQPISFEFRFLAEGQVFVYGFTVSQDAVVGEWLDASTETGREVSVYERDRDGIRIGKLTAFGREGSVLKKALGALKLLGVRDDQLLLNKIADLPPHHRSELLGRVAWWFTECLTVVEPTAEFPPLMDLLGADADFQQFCSAFLHNVGTGIANLGIESDKLDADKFPKSFLERLESQQGQDATIGIGAPGLSFELDTKEPTKIIRKNLAAKHRVSDSEYSIPFQDESDGTQRCLNLLPALYGLTRSSKVFVVDEIDRSLHPLLCHALLKLFLDARPGGCRQMIVTTHETHLLDLDLLRRDEIWFMEKDKHQQSRLSSLVDWKPRKDLRIEKGYLQGRFGGIPFIGDTQKLMDRIQRPVNGKQNEKKTTPT
jgi:AAA15 family ATPase/GTPase